MDFVLGLQGIEMDTKRPITIAVPTSAYDADMVCDLILSYTWLARTDALVNPRRHGILLKEDDCLVWVDGIIPEKKGTHGEGKHEELTLIVSPMVVIEEPQQPYPKEKMSQDKRKMSTREREEHRRVMETCARIPEAPSLPAQQDHPMEGGPRQTCLQQGCLEPLK